MSRTGITYLDVAHSAEELTASGTEPTIERIRAKLKTGSNSTIGTHLRIWRAKQDPLQQLATKEKIPEELIILLRGLWERVMEQAEKQVNTIKQDAQQELTQHQQIILQLQKDNGRLQQSEAQLKRACDSYAQEKIALEQIIAKSHTDIATSQAKCDGLVQQITDKQTRIEELHQQNKQAQANLEHYRTASLEQRQQEQQRAEQREKELTQTLQQISRENEAIRQQKIGLQQAYEQLQSTHCNSQAALSKLTLCAETNSAELVEANKLLAQKIESQQHWQTQHDKLYAKWEAQMAVTAELQAQNAILSQQISIIRVTLDDVSAQNNVLAHDKWLLGQEKAQLFGQLKQATRHLMKENQALA